MIGTEARSESVWHAWNMLERWAESIPAGHTFDYYRHRLEQFLRFSPYIRGATS